LLRALILRHSAKKISVIEESALFHGLTAFYKYHHDFRHTVQKQLFPNFGIPGIKT
jgi:hypothetical protein